VFQGILEEKNVCITMSVSKYHKMLLLQNTTSVYNQANLIASFCTDKRNLTCFINISIPFHVISKS